MDIGGHIRKGLAVGAGLTLALLLAEGALASSGEIDHAQTNEDWTYAFIAGTVDWTEECPGSEPQEPEPPLSSTCSWTPYATLGPATSDCTSLDRAWPDLGEGIQLVWSGGTRTGVGSASFDLPAVPLQGGDDAPLLCLSAFEVRDEIDCNLVPPGDWWDCHGTKTEYEHWFDWALLEPPASMPEPHVDGPEIYDDPPLYAHPIFEPSQVPLPTAGPASAESSAPRPMKRRCRGAKHRHRLHSKRTAAINRGQRSTRKRCKAGHRHRHGAKK